MYKFTVVLILLYITALSALAQTKDTIVVSQKKKTTVYQEASEVQLIETVDSTHSPRLAALYSAVLPGAGQFYNEKYWKIPLVYALGAFAAYQVKSNHQNYVLFLNIFSNLEDGTTSNDAEIAAYLSRIDDTGIERRVDAYKRDRDYWIILSAVFYVLNIVDATVDAHLREFSLNENLSMRVEPSIQQTPYQNMQAGVMLNFRIKGKNTN